MIEIKRFSELELEELYEILRLRSEVFVIEQTCIYQDLDRLDQKCLHLLYKEDGQIIGYARVLPPGLEYKEASLGRVIVQASHRNQGVARKLTIACIQQIHKNYPSADIKIMAQVYLKEFYSSFGFKVISEEFREDHLPHLYLLLKSEDIR